MRKRRDHEERAFFVITLNEKCGWVPQPKPEMIERRFTVILGGEGSYKIIPQIAKNLRDVNNILLLAISC